MIGPHAVINGPTRIGADNRIFQFASIGDAPQDKKYKGEPTRLEIGDRNVFREFCTMNRGTAHDKGVTHHRQRQPVHGVHARRARLLLGNKIVMANCATLGGHVEVGDWVIIGGSRRRASVLQGRRACVHRQRRRRSRGTCRPT